VTAGDAHAIPVIARNDVSFALGVAADGIGLSAAVDVDPIQSIAQVACTVGIDADVVGGDGVAQRATTIDANASPAVAGDDVSVGGCIAADSVVLGALGDEHPAKAVAPAKTAAGIGADMVAGDDVTHGGAASDGDPNPPEMVDHQPPDHVSARGDIEAILVGYVGPVNLDQERGRGPIAGLGRPGLAVAVDGGAIVGKDGQGDSWLNGAHPAAAGDVEVDAIWARVVVSRTHGLPQAGYPVGPGQRVDGDRATTGSSIENIVRRIYADRIGVSGLGRHRGHQQGQQQPHDSNSLALHFCCLSFAFH
jgi:hypothetical protein